MKRAKKPRITVRIDRRLFTLLLAGLIVGVAAYGAYTERLTLSTYYPAPFGVYQELRATGPAYFASQGGRVGIGTTNPRANLHVNGENRGTGRPNLDLLISNPGRGLQSIADINFHNETSGTWWHQTLRREGEGGGLEWHVRSRFDPSQPPMMPLVLTRAGAVGIGGIRNPAATLDVGGSARIRAIADVNRLVIQPRTGNPTNPLPGEIWLVR